MDEGHHRAHPYTYGGHSKRDYVAQDNAEMVELRARQRTFDGGYMRSMIMTLGSSIVFVRLFDERFYNIGILFVLLGAMLSILALLRRRHSNRDFSDQRRPLPTTHAEHERVLGGPFVTAGWIVIGVSAVVFGAEVALIALIMQI